MNRRPYADRKCDIPVKWTNGNHGMARCRVYTIFEFLFVITSTKSLSILDLLIGNEQMQTFKDYLSKLLLREGSCLASQVVKESKQHFNMYKLYKAWLKLH